MHDHGIGIVLDLTERLDKRADVIAIFHVPVCIAQRAEIVGLTLTVGVAQQAQVGIEAAVVLGYRHLVVVDHDDEIAAECRAEIKPLERLASTQRAVADHGNDILVPSGKVACLGQATRKAHPGRGVAYREQVIFALCRVCEAGDIIVVRGVCERLHTPREHLVDVCLVRHVIDNLVFWRVEDIVQGHRGLEKSEIGAHMASVCAELGQKRLAQCGTQLGQLVHRHPLDICGRVD